MVGFLVAIALFVLGVRAVVGSLLASNTSFGGVQINDGYSAPTTLLPNNPDVVNWFISGAQTTGNEKQGYICPYAGTIVDVRAYLTTAPTTSSFIVDLMKNGVALLKQLHQGR